MSQDKQFHMRVDDTFLHKVEELRRMKSPLPSAANVVKSAVNKYWHCKIGGAETISECVYVAEQADSYDRKIKVGVTKNLDKRGAALSGMVIVYHTDPRADARGLEKLTLRNARKKGGRVGGEYVTGLSLDDVIRSLREAEDMLK